MKYIAIYICKKCKTRQCTVEIKHNLKYFKGAPTMCVGHAEFMTADWKKVTINTHKNKLTKEEIDILRNVGLVTTVKAYRERTNASLVEAIDFVREYKEKLEIK